MAAVTLLRPWAEIGRQPSIGPLGPSLSSASAGTSKLRPETVTVSPGRMSGVRPTPPGSDSFPFCQQSPPGLNGVGVVVLTENGRNGVAKPPYWPITTGEPV